MKKKILAGLANHQEEAVLKQERLSEKVVYQYWMSHNMRSLEMLVASGRYYPGILINGHFYYGITAGKRFIPGILWCEHFIPGLVTRKGFVPGIITDSGFKPGVINSSVFMPGIVNGLNFIPGMVHDGHFIPGCHTTDQMFAPGRIWNHQFESGIIENKIFVRTNGEKLSPKVVPALPQEGYGMTNVRRYDPIGGVPIGGMIMGMLGDQPCYLPNGLVTNKGAVLGGWSDLKKQKYLVGTDPAAILEELGIEKEGDLGFGKAGAELLDKIEEWLGSMLPGGNNAFGTPDESGGPSLGEALNGLGQGASDLIDSLNKNNQDYWDKKMHSGAGGWIRQSGGDKGGSRGSGGYDENQDKRDDNVTILVVGSLASFAFKTGKLGTFFRNILTLAIYGMIVNNSVSEMDMGGSEGNAGAGGKGGDNPKQPSDDETVDPNTASIGAVAGPCLYPEIKGPRDRKIFEIKNTEEGRVIIVDHEALRDAVQFASKGTNIGLNVLTGETTWVYIEELTPEEIQKHKLSEMFMKIYTDPVFHPDEAASKGG